MRGGRSKREGVYVYTEQVHVVLQQKQINIVKQLYSKRKKEERTV